MDNGHPYARIYTYVKRDRNDCVRQALSPPDKIAQHRRSTLFCEGTPVFI